MLPVDKGNTVYYGDEAASHFLPHWRRRSTNLLDYATSQATGKPHLRTQTQATQSQADEGMAGWLAAVEPELPVTLTLPLLQAQTQLLYSIVEAQARTMPQASGDQQAVYPAILTAYIQVDDLARLVAAAWVRRFPDRFYGELTTPEAGLHVQLDQRLCLHAFLLARSGAAAYLGQAPLIQDKTLLTAAISIHNVEGQHAAILGELVGDHMNLAFPEPKTMAQVLEIIMPIINTTPTAMPNTGRVAVPSVRHTRHRLQAQ